MEERKGITGSTFFACCMLVSDPGVGGVMAVKRKRKGDSSRRFFFCFCFEKEDQDQTLFTCEKLPHA